MTRSQLAERDIAEVRRSAEEARSIGLVPSQVKRYLDPPADTAYSLEYAFYLLGDVRGKNVLDLGCGTGENVVPLIRRGAHVTAIDISPELIALAAQRLGKAGLSGKLMVGSAYETGLADESIDAIFCIALIHHLDIQAVRDEMYRILVKGGSIILSEPTRFSLLYDRLRKMLPARGNVSDHEHPLTQEELSTFGAGFEMEHVRYFRLPIIPLMDSPILARIISAQRIWKVDRWILQHLPKAEKYATNVTMHLRKPASVGRSSA
jgi:ubiquinone/menaquinone biosynthesis C-methylase UbiE